MRCEQKPDFESKNFRKPLKTKYIGNKVKYDFSHVITLNYSCKAKNRLNLSLKAELKRIIASNNFLLELFFEFSKQISGTLRVSTK